MFVCHVPFQCDAVSSCGRYLYHFVGDDHVPMRYDTFTGQETNLGDQLGNHIWGVVLQRDTQCFRQLIDGDLYKQQLAVYRQNEQILILDLPDTFDCDPTGRVVAMTTPNNTCGEINVYWIDDSYITRRKWPTTGLPLQISLSRQFLAYAPADNDHIVILPLSKKDPSALATQTIVVGDFYKKVLFIGDSTLLYTVWNPHTSQYSLHLVDIQQKPLVPRWLASDVQRVVANEQLVVVCKVRTTYCTVARVYASADLATKTNKNYCVLFSCKLPRLLDYCTLNHTTVVFNLDEECNGTLVYSFVPPLALLARLALLFWQLPPYVLLQIFDLVTTLEWRGSNYDAVVRWYHERKLAVINNIRQWTLRVLE